MIRLSDQATFNWKSIYIRG